MKGALVTKPLLFNLEVRGDDFCQGDQLVCTLTATNTSSASVERMPIKLDLCCADLKKTKGKRPGCALNSAKLRSLHL